jgi:hypothetical protein
MSQMPNPSINAGAARSRAAPVMSDVERCFDR